MSAKCFFVFRFAFPLFTEYNITKTTGEDIMKTMKHFFTLIEVLTVAAIIAILAGISVGVVGLINNKSAEAQTQATIKALELAIGQYKADNGCIYLPGGSSDLNKPLVLKVEIPNDLKGTLFKYLDQKLLNAASKDGYFIDGWGHPLIYRIPGKFNKTGFDLGSVGPDGKVGDGKGDPVTVSKLPTDSDFGSYFGQGDDVTNFLRKD